MEEEEYAGVPFLRDMVAAGGLRWSWVSAMSVSGGRNVEKQAGSGSQPEPLVWRKSVELWGMEQSWMITWAAEGRRELHVKTRQIHQLDDAGAEKPR